MNAWKERLSLLKYRGGLKAALFWVVKIIFRVEIHFLYAIDLTQPQVLPQSSREKPTNDGFRFLSLDTAQDLSMVPRAMIDKIGLQSGRGVEWLIKNDTSLYALVDQTSIVSQTNICRHSSIQVDSPTHLDIELALGDVFLGYLFTYPRYRGMGTARRLLKEVCEHVKRRGYSRIVTHIRSTNAPSLNTFIKCGWTRVGWIFTSTSGRLLFVHCPRKVGITVSAPALSNH